MGFSFELAKPPSMSLAAQLHEHGVQVAACGSRAGEPVDLVVACDCVYPDPDGPSPDAAHFVAALAALCAFPGAQGCCELRALHGAGACAEGRPAAAALVAASAASAEVCTSPEAAGVSRDSCGCAAPASRESRESKAAAAVPTSREATGGSEAAAEPLSDMPCSACSSRAEANGHCASAYGRALVTFEARSDIMRAAFLQAAQARFGCVRRLSAEELPLLYRVEHIEVYELASCKQSQT